jgi:peptidoglycan/LPS O-acetylase OafA/YrhL
MVNPIPSSGKVPSLDGWRAVAIIMVLGSHFRFASGFPQATAGLLLFFFDGDLGVLIFFVISGFLISLLILREAERTGGFSLRRFYMRRFFRIVPIYAAYLAVLALASLGGLYHDHPGSWVGALTFTRNMIGRGDSGTAHFWSLAIEEQFYLVWPVLIWGLSLWRRPALYAAILLVPVLACPIVRYTFVSSRLGETLLDRVFAPRSTLAYADALAVGCLGAWAAQRLPGRGEWRRGHTAALFGLIAVTFASHVVIQSGAPPVWNGLGPSLEAFSVMGCLWLSAHECSPLHRMLNSRVMVAIGVLSYSLYVWHMLFLPHFMGPAFAHWLVCDWRVWLLPACLVSAASYRFLEVPFMNLRSRFRG